MKRLVVLPVAEADLAEIGDYIALDNPVRARDFVRELRAQMAEAARRPRSFPLRRDLRPGLRASAKQSTGPAYGLPMDCHGGCAASQ